MRPFLGMAFLLALLTAPPRAVATEAEAIEIGPGQVESLPRGKEADGIIGDFVLRNGQLEALVSGNLARRKANMGTNWESTTPGCLFDLGVRGSDNDQLTNFAPGNLQGDLSSVRILSSGDSGTAVVVTERTAARGGGLHTVHEYRLGKSWRHVEVFSVYENHGAAAVSLKPWPSVKGLVHQHTVDGIACFDAQNPADRQGYAYSVLERSGTVGNLDDIDLKPGERRSYSVAVAPARSPAEAHGILARLKGQTGALVARLVDSEGESVSSAAIRILLGTRKKKVTEGEGENKKETEKTVELWLPAYPRADGTLQLYLPPGTYPIVARDRGRPDIRREVVIRQGERTTTEFVMDAASRVRFRVTDIDGGGKLPCKVQFTGVGDTADPYFGVPIQAHGCENQYHSEDGQFTLQVPPGTYRIAITRGIEYDHHEANMSVKPGQTVAVEATLRRVLDTRGWISTDYHNHSTPSGDNYCGTDDRIINLAAEHIEFAPATEHNRIYDWGPHIERLGLKEEISTVVGMELTGPNAHFNAFPLEPHAYFQDNGAPQWVHDPRINAINLRDFPESTSERWVHLNHPDVGKFLRDRDGDGFADGGYPGLERLVDAAEVWSTEILNLRPAYEVTRDGKPRKVKNRTFAWLQLLNQGRNMVCIAVSDAHSVFGNGVGGWRTYVESSVDDPAKIDYREVIRNSKAGRMFMTNGPFLEVETEDGTPLGGSTRALKPFSLRVRVQTNSWIEIDRVQVLVNGRAWKSLNFTPFTHAEHFRKRGAISFEGTIPISLHEDAHLIVAAFGENFNLATGYGKSWQSGMHPCAFTNPIFVDVDGNGFQPNGDTLGYPLPLGAALGE